MATPHIHGAAELAANVPNLLGFTPHESIVLAAVADDDSLGVLLRIDLADVRDRDLVGPLARSIAKHASRVSAKHLVTFTYTDEAADTVRDDVAELAHQVRQDVSADIDSYYVAGDTVHAYDCADVACCPKPIPAPNAALTARGTNATVDTEPFAALFTVDDDARTQAQSAVQRVRDLGGMAVTPPEWRTAGAAHWDRLVASVKRGPATETITADEAGAMIAYLGDRRIRDYVIVMLTPTTTQAALNVLTDANADVSEALDCILSAESGVAPDEADALAVWTLLAFLVNHAVGNQQAPMFATAGLIAFWRDEIATANALVDAALELDRDYRLAVLVGLSNLAGIRAGWVRREAAAKEATG